MSGADRLLDGSADILHTHARVPLDSGNGHYRGQRSCAVAFKLVFEPGGKSLGDEYHP